MLIVKGASSNSNKFLLLPGRVEDEHVSEYGCAVGDDGGLPPEVAGDGGGEDDVEDGGQEEVVAVLEHDDRVAVEVRQVDLLPLADHLGVLPHQQPADLEEIKDI